MSGTTAQSNGKRITSAINAIAAAGTREKLITGNDYETHVQSVTIKALTTNGGLVYVGDMNVSAAAAYFPLDANETITFEVSDFEWYTLKKFIDLEEIWIDSAVNGEGVSFTYIRD